MQNSVIRIIGVKEMSYREGKMDTTTGNKSNVLKLDTFFQMLSTE